MARFTSLALIAALISIASGMEITKMPGFIDIGPVTTDPVPADSNGRVSIQARRYMLSGYGASWTEAFGTCRDFGGNLATPMNPSIDDELRGYVLQQQFGANLWVGARNSGNAWWWETVNQRMLWTKWKAGCGNSFSGCAYASGSGGSWGWCDASCNNQLQFVCEV